MEKFEKFIICPSWFPSPQYPEDFHTSEIFEEDGVILYSGEHLIHSFMQAAVSFNFCLYELIKAFYVEYDDQDYPEVSWDQLEKLEVRNRTEIKDYINLALEDIDPLADDIYRFLYFNELDSYVESANAADIPAINIENA